MADHVVVVQLAHVQDYQFDVQFEGGLADVRSDEPAPLGAGTGPSPAQLLVAAVATCLADSLLFGLRKFKLTLAPATVHASATIGRNAEQRLRVLGVDVALTLDGPASGVPHLDRVLAQFETYCTVSQSVGQGIPIQVSVLDADGVRLSPAATPGG